MSWIYISTPTFDLEGALCLKALPSSDFGEYVRRGSKVATLDGGVSAQDFGYTDSDREFRLSLKPTAAQDRTLKRLVKSYATVRVSTQEGVYDATPRYLPGATKSVLRLSITNTVT